MLALVNLLMSSVFFVVRMVDIERGLPYPRLDDEYIFVYHPSSDRATDQDHNLFLKIGAEQAYSDEQIKRLGYTYVVVG